MRGRKVQGLLLVGIFVWALVGAPAVEPWVAGPVRIVLLLALFVGALFWRAWKTWRDQNRTF